MASAVWSDGAARAVEALLRVAGRSIVLRVGTGAEDALRDEVTLRSCVLRVNGDVAELIVAAGTMKSAAEASGAALFDVTTRITAGDVVWRVVSHAAVECGAAVLCWRVQLAR